MAKSKKRFICDNCGSESPNWQGQCGQCSSWNSLTETAPIITRKRQSSSFLQKDSRPISLSEVSASKPLHRIKTSVLEFDHVLGGGLVPGSVILLGGDPGIGKSTLLSQTLGHLSEHHDVLYVTGEESTSQVCMRLKRLGVQSENLLLYTQTHVETILATIEKKPPAVMVIDSIQTLYTDEAPSAPGSVSQVRESAALLSAFAKAHHMVLFLIGHVTKDGQIAGPKVLEHMVDTVLYFENATDSRYRIVRSVKNRFGAVNELGLFVMTDKGLKEVENPSAMFLSGQRKSVPGTVVLVTWEGTRSLLLEVQALVDESKLANPRRLAVGIEHNRLSMLLAILNRHVGVTTADMDVFVNIAGGVKVVETAADLAIMLSVISSLKEIPLSTDLVVFGEVGLTGEIRPVSRGIERVKEAIKHGFKRVILSKDNKLPGIKGIEIIAVSTITEAVSHLTN